MAEDVKIQGVDEIVERFEEIANADTFKRAMAQACALVEGEARKNAPKGVGDLRRYMESRVEEQNGVIVGIVSNPLEYAPYVEFGTGLFAEDGGGRQDVPWCYQDEKGEWHSTRGRKPAPFLRPALNDNRENVKKILKRGLKND